MKKYIAIISVAFALVSCSLKEEFTSYTKNEDYYNNKIQIQSGINACYSMLRTMYGGNAFWMTTECTTDLMYLNQSTMYNATLNISPSKPAFASYHQDVSLNSRSCHILAWWEYGGDRLGYAGIPWWWNRVFLPHPL